MDRSNPDTATIETAVALALRAPSAHNAQPWCWRIGYSTLHLFADRDRRPPEPDPGERDLLLGCGAALHHLRVGFAALGWRAEAHRLPDTHDPDHLAVVTAHPARPAAEAIAQAAAIPHRRTDRRGLSAVPIARHHLDTLTRAAAREGATLRVLTGAARRLVLEAIAEHAGRSRPGTLLTRPPGPGTGGALLVLTTTTDDRQDRLRAGEAASAVLLSATALGLSTCPLTDPLKGPGFHRATLARTTGGHPQIVLRVGWAPPGAHPPPATPRRPLGHVLEPLQAPPKYHHRLSREEEN
ncbi:NAD(P)H nitroreductase [Amycolatopsis stemonae]